MADYNLGTATGEIVIGTDQAKRSVAGLTSSLNSSLSKAGQSMARTGQRLSFGVTLPLVGIGVAAVKTSLEFTKTMNTMAAVAGVPGPQLEKLRALSIKLGQDTVFSANEAGQGMLELAKAGVSVSDIMGGALSNTLTLATAGDLGLADAATIAANAMNVFGIKGKDTQQVVDALAGAANASSADVAGLAQSLTQGGNAAALAGLDIQDTTAFLGALADQGIKGSDAGTSLKTFMLSLVPTSKTAQDAIKKLNLDFVDQQGNIRNINDVADELHNKLGGLTQVQQQVALKTIFGTDAFRAGAVAMKLGSDGLAEYEAATRKVGTASDVAAGKLKGLPGVIETLKGSIDTALLTIGDTLQPIVSSVANVITDLLNVFIALPQPVKIAIVAIAALAAAAGPILFIFGQAAVLFSVLAGPIGLIVAAIVGLVAAFVALNGGVTQTIKNVQNFFSNLGKALKPALESMKTLVSGVVDAFKPLLSVFDDVSKNAKGKAGNALSIITDAINGLAKVLAVVVPAAARGLVAFILFLIKNVPIAWRAISDGAAAVMNFLQPLFAFIGGAFLDIWHALVDVWNQDLKPALADLGGLFNDLKSIFVDLWPAIKVIGIALGVIFIVPLLLIIKTIPAAIKVLGFLIKVIIQVVRTVVAAVKLIVQFLRNLIGAIIRFVASANHWFGQFVAFISRIPGDVAKFFQAMYNAVVDWVGKAAKWITDKWNGIVAFFRSLGGKLANAGKHMWDWIVDGARAIANTAIGIINAIIDRINSFQIHIHVDPPGPGQVDFDWSGAGIPHIPTFATGIKRFTGGLAIVGESGPELVSLPKGSDVLPNRILRSLERNTSVRGGQGSLGVAAPRSLHGVAVIGTVETPFGPAELRGMIRDEIDDTAAFSKELSRMRSA